MRVGELCRAGAGPSPAPAAGRSVHEQSGARQTGCRCPGRWPGRPGPRSASSPRALRASPARLTGGRTSSRMDRGTELAQPSAGPGLRPTWPARPGVPARKPPRAVPGAPRSSTGGPWAVVSGDSCQAAPVSSTGRGRPRARLTSSVATGVPTGGASRPTSTTSSTDRVTASARLASRSPARRASQAAGSAMPRSRSRHSIRGGDIGEYGPPAAQQRVEVFQRPRMPADIAVGALLVGGWQGVDGRAAARSACWSRPPTAGPGEARPAAASARPGSENGYRQVNTSRACRGRRAQPGQERGQIRVAAPASCRLLLPAGCPRSCPAAP